MKKVFWINPIIFAAILLLIACKKEPPSGDPGSQYPQWPVVKILEVTNLTDITATLNGTVNPFGLSTTITFEYGTTTNYGSSVSPLQSPVTLEGNYPVSVDIYGLTPCTIYHFRLKAENSKWINFCSTDSTFITFPNPKVKTLAANNISDNRAKLNGVVNANFLFTRTFTRTLKFEYGKTTSYGYWVNASQSQAIGDTLTYISADIKDLMADTTYHFRIRAEVSDDSPDVIFGSDMEFIAKGLTIITVEVTNITDSSAVATGYIAGYVGDITGKGFYFRIASPRMAWTGVKDTIGTGTGNFQCNLTGLHAGTTYWVRAYADNSSGTVHGNVLSFKTSE